MAVTASDIVWRKSAVVTDTSANGGVVSDVAPVSGARNNIFPYVSKAQRTAGVTRYRKIFWKNAKAGATPEAANYPTARLLNQTNAGDRKAIGLGTQTDTQASLATAPPIWTGTGTLDTALSGAETSVDILMESTDFDFVPGGDLYISDKYKVGQTVDADVSPGDTVEYAAAAWSKVTFADDITYPSGWYLGGDVVLTFEDGVSTEETVTVLDGTATDEDIGTGDGADTSPVLSTLSSVTNGLFTHADYLPVVTATCGGVERTVNIAADGTCSGYCSAGEIDMTAGTWTTEITWTTAPDNATDILITYTRKTWTYTGNVVTVELDGMVANAYSTTDTYCAGCIQKVEAVAEVDGWTETSASGTFDETTYPVIARNDGAVEDDWTLTFSSGSAFAVVGARTGALESGNTSTNYAPTNAAASQPYFTIDLNGWGGTWASGDTIEFSTHPAVLPIWIRQIVPAATAAESSNFAAYEVVNE